MSAPIIDSAPSRYVDLNSVSRVADDLFGHLPRADQRRWAEAYLRALLTTPGRKSIRRLADAISNSPTTPQSLQQFVNQSPWDWMPARHALARIAEPEVTPKAWVIGQAVIPKRGQHSVGVQRRYFPKAGRTINCQIGLGLFLTSKDTSVPIDWRLALDSAWCDDEERRQRVRIPDHVDAVPEWAHILDMVAHASSRWSLSPMPLVAELRGMRDISRLATGTAGFGLDFVFEIDGSQPVFAQNDKPASLRPMTAREVIRQSSARPYVSALSPHGPARRTVTMLAATVHLPAAPHGRPGNGRPYRLLAEWSPSRRRPTRYWLTNVADRGADEVLPLLRLRAGVEDAMQDLSEEFGMLDFEGRSFPGWHHHMTLVSAAYAYSRVYTMPFPGSEPDAGHSALRVPVPA